MNELAPIIDRFRESVALEKLAPRALEPQSKTALTGLTGSAVSMMVQALHQQTQVPVLLILDDKEEAAYHFNDLERLTEPDTALFFPSSYRRPYQIEETDNANVLLRAEVLNRVNSRRKPAIIVTYPDALFEKVVTKKELEKNTLKLGTGDDLSIDFVNEVLFDYKFNRVDFVTEPGEFSLRGGILDVFSFSHDKPYRIEFFGDEVDSIRTFDVETQLSEDQVKKISIIPNVENKASEEMRQSFLEYVGNKTVVILKNAEALSSRLDVLMERAIKAYNKMENSVQFTSPDKLFAGKDFLMDQLSEKTLITLSRPVHRGGKRNESDNSDYHEVQLATAPQPAFNRQFELLRTNLRENDDAGITTFICCGSQNQARRFNEIFAGDEVAVPYKTIVLPLYRGFIASDLGIACYTDHEIFERYHKFTLKNGYAKKQAITIKELSNMEIGDYVTHIDHGIGKFAGLQKIDMEGKPQEAIKLVYGDRDFLYVSIHALHKISKYNGKDGKAPKIYKLGSGAWKALKQKTKKKVKQIAYDLIQLYAKRRLKEGFKFSPDSYLQHELEASFIYEDTPDQHKATEDVKRDMENIRPMDRLVCGDVGFGKTEVAIRAAFKAVDNGKQVAVLVPTTILAYQHWRTFTERLGDLPVTVDYLNRFRTAKERRAVLEGLENGKLDIVIGTHQIVGKAVNFKDLGLLIVDEEQKFGVGVKDKLKTLKENVDTLTLTATPIPRTLQFSLMAARDLSVITTPPPNRYPVETKVVRFSDEVIRDAVLYEVQRGGQVFFVHNRIENIKEIAGMIQRLVPDAKVAIGHGQMDGKKLEDLMLRFIEGEFDVLVSTTIIESGLDVPNANTIFINNANNFGLSDLHQMRGRVGRSNKKAFCYFITPPYSVMTDDARKRIEALEQFSTLGSGFNIAMKDLEIRGAGDLLGGEQSGFINEIGFDTYQQILNEAINELKEKDFADLYEDEEHKEYLEEVNIDTDFQMQFPPDYVNSVAERLKLYGDLAKVEDEEQLARFEEGLIDRFGPVPEQGKSLLDSVRIKWHAKQLGIEKLILKKGLMVGYFISDQDSKFYQSPAFTSILQYVQLNPGKLTVKEKKTRNGLRLLLRIERIKSVDKALMALNDITSFQELQPADEVVG